MRRVATMVREFEIESEREEEAGRSSNPDR
jgi:hypothetical protein